MKITILRDQSETTGGPDRLEEFAKFIVLAVLCIILVGVFTPIDRHPPYPRETWQMDSRNAQNFASVCSSAMAAGSEDFRDIDNALDAALVIQSGTYGRGEFENTFFNVPNVSEREFGEMMKHLIWEPVGADGHGGLVYALNQGSGVIDSSSADGEEGENGVISALEDASFGEPIFDAASME